MKVSVVIPCFRAAGTLSACLQSVVGQEGVDLELLVMDGGSDDDTATIVESFGDRVSVFRSESDQGPADAINKGFALASGEVVAWLNADDVYAPGALKRVVNAFETHPEAAFLFGHCPIVDEGGEEIRKGITRFKECFYPLQSRFVFQCINYLSQPACFFRRGAVEAAGPLRLDLKAAWDYEFLLRIHRQGKGVRIPRPELARFCWHPGSISGQHFRQQFAEEFEAAKADAGRWAPQTWAHWFVRHGIVGAYSWMQRRRGQ